MQQHVFCQIVGSTALVASWILKKLPEQWNDKLPKPINEKASLKGDTIVTMYQKQAGAKVSTMKDPLARVNPA